MQLAVISVFVDDQAKALKFYTEKLGLVLHTDMLIDEASGARWLTVVSPEATGGVQMSLEPNQNPIARSYQSGLMQSGLPAFVMSTTNLQVDYDRLKAAGVVFTVPPQAMGPVISSIFEDTCGNLVNLVQVV